MRPGPFLEDLLILGHNQEPDGRLHYKIPSGHSQNESIESGATKTTLSHGGGSAEINPHNSAVMRGVHK